jgi:hypothetical protein
MVCDSAEPAASYATFTSCVVPSYAIRSFYRLDTYRARGSVSFHGVGFAEGDEDIEECA